jgi:PII-like signaling protein
MKDPVKLLLVFVNEADRWDGVPLYHAIVQRLRQLHVAGATAQVGLQGFGHHHRLHAKGLFGIADDRPVTIMVVDEEARLRAVLPEVSGMVREGLVLLVDAELVGDRGAPPP